MYRTQAAMLRVIRDNPGVSQARASRLYASANPGASRYTVKCIHGLLEAVPRTAKNPGRGPYLEKRDSDDGKSFALSVTVEGAEALALYDARNALPPTKYKGSPEPTRFVTDVPPATALIVDLRDDEPP